MKKKTLLILFVFICIPILSYSQGMKFKALYLYNFTKLIEWPENINNSSEFVIGVVGSPEFHGVLSELTLNKTVSSQHIVVKKFFSAKDIQQCHIVYISKESSEEIDEIIAIHYGKPVLIITDKPGMIKRGAEINFTLIEGKLKFEVNQQNIESQSLKASSILYANGIITN